VYRLIHKDEAHNHAALKCRQNGCRKGSKEYESTYEEAFGDYLNGIKKATTVMENPVRAIEENPTTPKISKEVWEVFDVMDNEKGFFAKAKKLNATSDWLAEKKHQFKGGIGSLINVFLEITTGLRTKGEKGAKLSEKDKISSFQYVSMEGKPPVSETDKKAHEEYMIQVEKNRYARLFVLANLMPRIDKFFMNNFNYDIAADMKDNEEKYFGKKNISYKELNSTKTRVEFVKKVMNDAIASLEASEKK
jgi:hypothetical protein